MLRLLGLVISIGLADSMNPSSMGPALYLAAGPRPRRSVLQVAGIFVTTLGATGLGLKSGGRTGRISRRVRHLLTHP